MTFQRRIKTRRLIVALLLCLTVTLQAAWGYEQNFDALSTADLNGQDSWSGSAEYDVQTSITYQGAKAVAAINQASEPSISRSFSATGDGDLFFAVRKDTTTATFRVSLTSGGGGLMYIRFGTDNDIRIWDSAGYNATALVDNYLADTWYPVNVQFNDATNNNQYRARVYSGGAWGAFSAYMTVNGGSYTTVDGITLFSEDGNGAQTSYFDTITATDPTAAPPGGGSTCRRLLLLGAGC